MSLISKEYRALLEEMHKVRDDFGISGKRYSKEVMMLCHQLETRDVLDYGCGKGTLRKSLPMADVKNYDPAVPQWSEAPSPADIVVCTDVLEHIEEDCLVDVISHIKSLAKKCVFLQVATRPAIKILPDGRNCHLIVKPMIWWVDYLDKRLEFTLMQLTNYDNDGFIAVYKNPDQKKKDKKIDL